MIKVKLFATLRKGREKEYDFSADRFKSGEELRQHLGIDVEDVSVFLINGLHGKLSDSFKDGDVISIFPPVGGG